MRWLILALPPGIAAGVMGAGLVAAGGTVDPTSLWAQYGFLGVSVAALAKFALEAYRRERERADRNETEVKRLNDLIIGNQTDMGRRFLEALDRSSEALSGATHAVVAAKRRGT